jgi:quinol monooxygenase YgiN
MSPITLHITWQLRPSTTSKFLELVQALIAHVKQESECLYFNVFHVSEFGPKPAGEHGDTMKLVEMWDPAGTEEERGRWLREVSLSAARISWCCERISVSRVVRKQKRKLGFKGAGADKV